MHIHPDALEAALSQYFELTAWEELSIDEDIAHWQQYAEKNGLHEDETPLHTLFAAKNAGVSNFNKMRFNPIREPKAFDSLYEKLKSEYIAVKAEQNSDEKYFIEETDFINYELEKLDTLARAVEQNSKYFHHLSRWIEYLDKKRKAAAGRPLFTKTISADTGATYSVKQIGIAYFFLNIMITKENAVELAKRYNPKINSSKLYQKRVSKASDLTSLPPDKSAATKHLQDLRAAKRLVSGTNNKNALSSADTVLAAFEAKYNSL